MNEIGYIITTVFNKLAAEPGRLITVLEFACICILLVAMITDSILRRRPPARQKSLPQNRAKAGLQFAMVRNNRRDLPRR